MFRYVRHRLIAGYVCFIALLGVASLVCALSTSGLRAHYTHTVNTLDALSTDALSHSKLMDDEETGLRGYLLTRDTAFLEPLTAASAALPTLQEKMQALAHAAPDLRHLTADMVRRADGWRAWAARTGLDPGGTTSIASLRASQLAGKSLFDAYRASAGRVTDRLAAMRQRDLAASTNALDYTDIFLAADFAVAVLLGIVVAWLGTRSVVRPLTLLGEAADEIGSGELAHPVTLVSAHEFEQLAASMERMRRQLLGQRDLTTIVNSTLHLDEIYESFAAHVRELVPFDLLSLVLIEDDGATIVVAYSTGLATDSAIVGQRRPFVESLCRQVYERDDLFIYEDVGALSVPVLSLDIARASAEGLRSGGLVPLRVRGRVTAIIHVASVDAHTYTPASLGPIVALAPLIAAALENARLYQTLEATAGDLTRSNRELEQFAYVASHDLQEPLRMIASYIQLLQRRYQGHLDERADQFIAYAVDGVTRMQTLINDLLTYSRVGRQAKPFEPTECNEIVDRCIASLSRTIAETGAHVTYGSLPTVWGDTTELGQLFQNLISNALKFCRDGTPEVSISAERHDLDWLFRVRDNGIGLDPAYAERIFVIFQRLHTKEEYPGTGIGLAICKKIVERHGGRIWVEPQPGNGATFLFTLPDLKTMKGRAA